MAVVDFIILEVPLAVGAGLLQASLYDVPGGFRAVMFDRFTGVKDVVRELLLFH